MAIWNSAKSSLLVAAAVALTTLPVGSALSAPPPPRVLGLCSPSKTKYVLSSRGNMTAANGSLVNIAETGFGFRQARSGCVIVDFTAYVEVTDFTQDSVVVRATLTPNGGATVLGVPTDARFQPANNEYDVRTVEFVFANVAPGSYRLRMLMGGNSATPTDTIHVASPNVVVHYN